MKKGRKALCASIAAGILLILGIAAVFLYGMQNRYTDIDTKVSPDGRCRITLQMKGEPLGLGSDTFGRIVAEYDGSRILERDVVLQNGVAPMQPGNWSVEWAFGGMRITLKGSGQRDSVTEFLYDGSEFHGYDAFEIEKEMQKRYGDVILSGMEGDWYRCEGENFGFCVEPGLDLRDNYAAEYFRYLTDQFFLSRNRLREFLEEGIGPEKIYVPIIGPGSAWDQEKESFSRDVTDWLAGMLEELPLEENRRLYTRIQIAIGTERYDYEPEIPDTLTEEGKTSVYNRLYRFVDQKLSEYYAEGLKTEQKAEEEAPVIPSKEQVALWMTFEPDCSYRMPDGTWYYMLPVDRALGSSYYVLIALREGEEEPSLVNTDPYLGSGGGAEWISFLEDGRTGFSCLSRGAGTLGVLYRTEDGGKSFTEVEYPSSNALLPDGSYYNPFVMPQKVYEEDGKLYMEAGQGAMGDYYGEQGFCHGLYESADLGKTWQYMGEIPVDRD